MKPFNPEIHSLTDFVRMQGGISTKKEFLKGECRDYFSIAEGYNLINNKIGKTLDRLVELSMEAGFLFFDATITDFLDQLKKDVYSKKLFKKGCVWSFAKQDWKEDIFDLEEMFYLALLRQEEEIYNLSMADIYDDGFLMPESVFNQYYGGVRHA